MINWSEYTKVHKGTTWFPKEILDKYAKGKILDIGCGTGQHLGKIKNFEKKCGVDPSETAIKEAQNSFPDCEFVIGSTYHLPYKDDYFDLVFSIDVVEHLEYPEKMIAETRRVLKQNGVCITQTPNYPIKRFYDFVNWLNPRSFRKTIKDDETHVSKFSYFSLKHILERHFHIIEAMPRNVLLENRFKLARKIKDSFLGKIIGQKIIIVSKK